MLQSAILGAIGGAIGSIIVHLYHERADKRKEH